MTQQPATATATATTLTGAGDHVAVATYADTVQQLTAWFQDRVTHLNELASVMVSELAITTAGTIDLTETSRRKLKSLASKYLAENPEVDGCGLIFAHSALGTPNGHLEWWVREDESRFARYSFGVVPGGDRYYDYEQHEWFTRAYQDGKAALVGPYIDYLGVEVYVLTFTVPAVAHGIRVGAVGNDFQAIDLERELLPLLQQCPEDLIIVNGHDTVLCSNTSRYLPGDSLVDASERFTRTSLFPNSDDAQLLTPVKPHSKR